MGKANNFPPWYKAELDSSLHLTPLAVCVCGGASLVGWLSPFRLIIQHIQKWQGTPETLGRYQNIRFLENIPCQEKSYFRVQWNSRCPAASRYTNSTKSHDATHKKQLPVSFYRGDKGFQKALLLPIPGLTIPFGHIFPWA